MEPLQSIISQIDSLVWGPVMLVLLMGTGLFLSIRTRFLGPRNLFFALKTSLGKEARQSGSGPGDISSFSALTTALAATIGTRKYRRSSNRHGIRRTGSFSLDVAFCPLRHDIQIQ